MEFYRPTNLSNNFVLVNGTARCGKSLLSPILASFDNVEIERMEGIFDYIAISHYFGSIEEHCAVSLLRTVADEYLYNSFLSRNTNFRWSDHSSVFKNPNRSKYFKRLFKQEGPNTVSRIMKAKPIYQNQGHDQMRFVSLLLRAWPGTFRMIEIVRDPIDQIDAWWRRGLGIRFCNDPMMLTPCIKIEERAVPFYAYGWESEYLEMAPMDRVIKMLHGLQFTNRDAYESLSESDKNHIKVIRFEKLVTETLGYVDEIAKFLGVKTTKYTKEAIKKQGCPRIQHSKKRLERYSNIKKTSSTLYMPLVEEMIDDYKVEWS